MNVFKDRAIGKNEQFNLSPLPLPEGTEVEGFSRVTEIDKTEYLLSTEVNRRHLLKALADAENPQNYIYVDPEMNSPAHRSPALDDR